jgi:hypothetical protein
MPNLDIPAFGASSILVPLALFLALLVFWSFITSLLAAFSSPRHKLRPLVSDWERKTLTALRKSMPLDWHVCPQVRLADFLVVEGGGSKTNWAATARVRSRSVDFLIIDDKGFPRLVIELDDTTHRRSDRRKRDGENDAAYNQAGLPVRHVSPGHPPDWTAMIQAVVAVDR